MSTKQVMSFVLYTVCIMTVLC